MTAVRPDPTQTAPAARRAPAADPGGSAGGTGTCGVPGVPGVSDVPGLSGVPGYAGTDGAPGVGFPAAPPTAPAPSTGRHARAGSGVPSGPLVPLRTVVPQRRAAPRSEIPAAVEPAAGRLVIDSSYSRLTPHLGARKVAVSVDGLPWRFAWGRTPIDLPAGRHLVEIEVEHPRAGRRTWGHAADAVPVAEGNTVEVFYRAPALPRLAGSLGPDRQCTAGFSLCAALLVLGGAAALAATALLVLAVVLLVG